MPRAMAYRKLTNKLRELYAAHAEAEFRKMPVDEIIGERTEHRFCIERECTMRREKEEALGQTTRREFLWKSAAAVTGIAIARPLHAFAITPRIVVVGAGMAGIRFAHALWNDSVNPLPSTIYEANERIGGRVWTNRDYFAAGQISEHGGEFISSEHQLTRRLAERFNLQLAVVNGGAEPKGAEVFWMDGAYYTYREANRDFQHTLPALQAALRAAPSPQTYNHHTQAGVQLDHMSVPQWIEQHVVGGPSGKLGRLLLEDVISEYGGNPEQQSALNLNYLLAFNSQLNPLAGTDEKYHVIGGNDQLITEMIKQLPQDRIVTGTSLVALRRNQIGTYTCTFQRAHSTFDIVADHVVLALPFTMLKTVDLSQAGFSSLKMTAINNYVLGTNAKLALQFNSRPWLTLDGFDGSCYSAPNSFEVCFESTVTQPAPEGILLDFPGGDAGGPTAFPGAVPHGPAPATAVDTFLAQVDGPYPGCSAAYNGRAYLDWWATDPYHFGAYAFYQPGQYTEFSGYERVHEGNVHFCGEHTSLNFQGLIEGAVESAERLAFNWPNL